MRETGCAILANLLFPSSQVPRGEGGTSLHSESEMTGPFAAPLGLEMSPHYTALGTKADPVITSYCEGVSCLMIFKSQCNMLVESKTPGSCD